MPYADPEAEREYQRQYTAGRRAQLRSALATMKLERGCADCGYAAHPEALDFDHVRGEKLFSLGGHHGRWKNGEYQKSNIGRMSLDRILNETEKCEVVCANCHRVRTSERRAA